MFAEAEQARVVANTHGLAGAFLDATPLAWVLMPDHWHGVLRLGNNAALSDVVRQFKTRVCRELRLACGFHGPLWQPAYHDHRLCDDTAITTAITYLRANPVRAGLCAHPDEYPYVQSFAPPS